MPDDIESTLEAGFNAQERGDYELAARLYRRAAQVGSVDGMLHLGILYDERGDTSEALRWFTAAAKTGDLEALTTLGIFQFKQGDLGGAITSLTESAEAGDTEAMVQLGSAHHQLGQHEHAMAWYSRAGDLGNSEARSAIAALSASRSNASSKGACYIATAVYGSYDAPPVMVLRKFRDERLATSSLGRAFIRLYYVVSPTIAKHFERTNVLSALARILLDTIVKRLDFTGPTYESIESRNEASRERNRCV